MAANRSWLINGFSSMYRHLTNFYYFSATGLQLRNYAARKGTREKAKRKKVKVVIEKVGFIPHHMRESKLQAKKNKRVGKNIILDDSKRTEAIDNVWIGKCHKWKVYSFEEAVQAHCETHHSTIYNLPNAPIKALIELDMQGIKQTKFVDSFTQITCIPHGFDHGQSRKILAFCKDPEMQEIAKDAGAHFVGGKDLIKQIQNGDFSMREFDVVLSEPTILPDLLLIRGLMRKKFPSTKLGTLSPNIEMLVTKFLNGVRYTAKQHELLKSYGTIDVTFGTLDMHIKQLEENLVAILNDVNNAKPNRPGPFITRTRLVSLPSPEMFKIEFEQYLPNNNAIREESEAKEEEREEGEEEKMQDAVIASH